MPPKTKRQRRPEEQLFLITHRENFPAVRFSFPFHSSIYTYVSGSLLVKVFILPKYTSPLVLVCGTLPPSKKLISTCEWSCRIYQSSCLPVLQLLSHPFPSKLSVGNTEAIQVRLCLPTQVSKPIPRRSFQQCAHYLTLC